jgi:hypothetical protein
MQEHDRSAIVANSCIVVANEPRAYREVLAAALHELRPHLEVICSEPDDLDGNICHRSPRLVLCSRLTEAVETYCDAWILLYPNRENRAVISVAGRRTVVTNVEFSHVLSVIDEVEPRLSE